MLGVLISDHPGFHVGSIDIRSPWIFNVVLISDHLGFLMLGVFVSGPLGFIISVYFDSHRAKISFFSIYRVTG